MEIHSERLGLLQVYLGARQLYKLTVQPPLLQRSVVAKPAALGMSLFLSSIRQCHQELVMGHVHILSERLTTVPMSRRSTGLTRGGHGFTIVYTRFPS